MQDYTVCFFGHRELCDLERIEARLTPILTELIRTHDYVSFLIGRNGEFDEFVASVIKRIQKAVEMRNNEMTLILPYTVSNLPYYETYYDSVLIPEPLHRVHPKAAITLKNRWMIEQSDLVIVNVERQSGGAYAAMKYAQQLQKPIINIAR